MAKVFVTNAGALALQKRALAGQTEERFRQVAQAQARAMKAAAERLSRGSLSTATLRRMGHPYSRRFPAGAAGQPDAVINRQTGRLAASWKTRVQKTARGYTLTLWNDAPEAKFMMGTKSMRARPILEVVLKETEARLPAATKKVIRQAIAQNGAATALPGWMGAAYAVTVGVTSAAGAVGEAF